MKIVARNIADLEDIIDFEDINIVDKIYIADHKTERYCIEIFTQMFATPADGDTDLGAGITYGWVSLPFPACNAECFYETKEEAFDMRMPTFRIIEFDNIFEVGEYLAKRNKDEHISYT